MSRDVSECPGCGFFHTRVELFQADDEGVEGATVDHRLGQLGRVFGDGAEDESSRLFVESVLFGEGIDELGQNVGLDHRLGQVVVVVGQPTEG